MGGSAPGTGVVAPSDERAPAVPGAVHRGLLGGDRIRDPAYRHPATRRRPVAQTSNLGRVGLARSKRRPCRGLRLETRFGACAAHRGASLAWRDGGRRGPFRYGCYRGLSSPPNRSWVRANRQHPWGSGRSVASSLSIHQQNPTEESARFGMTRLCPGPAQSESLNGQSSRSYCGNERETSLSTLKETCL